MQAEKRKYNKISPYWENRKPIGNTQTETLKSFDRTPDLKYETFGENLMASCASASGATSTRGKANNSPYFNGSGINGFENLLNFPLPYEISNGKISIGRTIDLVMRAYTGFPVFRNAIEVLVEFTNTPMHVKGGNAKSRAFIEAWFKRINVQSLTEQFFREYYRSGNVFIYRFDGKIRDDDFNRMKEIMGSKKNILPIRYILINPASVFVENATIVNKYTYVKLLSPFEIQRLKYPQTPQEEEMFNSLPTDVKQQIKNSSGMKNIYMPIDIDRLYYVFYKKQDYEPLATPMGFGILNDIEHKLQLKRIDMALTKTIEHAFLKITMGAKPEDGGINANNMQAVSEIFKTASIGRVFVGDWTTKAEWVIPDLKQLLGPEKYEVVDNDIKEGLQSILLGEDKFANALIKARVFNERLKEGRMVFKRDFIQPEINRICEEMNFKSVPTVEFEEISLEDDTNLQRLYTRWAELGILAPWELMRAKQTGLLPIKEDNVESQKEYRDLREKDFYYPLIGASAEKEDPNAPGAAKSGGRPSGTKSKQTTKKMSPIGGGVSSVKLQENVIASTSLLSDIKDAFQSKFKLEKLEEPHLELITSLQKAIMANEKTEDWKASVNAYIENPKEIDKSILDEIYEIQIMHDVEENQAILLNKSKIV